MRLGCTLAANRSGPPRMSSSREAEDWGGWGCRAGGWGASNPSGREVQLMIKFKAFILDISIFYIIAF